MKNFILFFMIAFVCSYGHTSFAAKKDGGDARKPSGTQGALKCDDNNGGPDNGYTIYISKMRNRADVQEITIAGAHTIATLSCSKPDHTSAAGPDQITQILACSEPNIRDGGYSVSIETGGLAGLTTAHLSEVTIAGSNSIAQFICKPAQ